MLEKTSQDFRKIFLIEFTKELIRNSSPIEFFELENAVKSQEQEEKEKIKQIVKQTISRQKVFEIASNSQFSSQKQMIKEFERQRANMPLIIPEPRLPPHLQYLRPIPSNVELDLDKLNPFVKDPMVREIECNGAGENIFVHAPDSRNTGISLSKEEIDEVIKKFSEAGKIPINEGATRIAVGKLVLLAIVSEVVGSKFIIKKMIGY